MGLKGKKYIKIRLSLLIKLFSIIHWLDVKLVSATSATNAVICYHNYTQLATRTQKNPSLALRRTRRPPLGGAVAQRGPVPLTGC